MGPRIEPPKLALGLAGTKTRVESHALQKRIERDARFASDVSHELRSPLTTLTTALGVLEARRDDLPDRSRQALDLLSADVHRFQRLVQDLLEISRFDVGAEDLTLEDVRVGELVIHTIESHADASVPVEIEGAARDVARAEQVFMDYDVLRRSGYTFNNGDLGSMLRVLTTVGLL